MGAVLDDAQIERYHRDGFLRVEGFVDVERCQELKAAAEAIIDGFSPTEQRTIFTTSEQERVSNGEFLSSGSGIVVLLRRARPDRRQQDRARDARSRPHVRAASATRRELADVAADIGLVDALALQSMYILMVSLRRR